MNDGHSVVGIDGLKIEPVSPEISGVQMADGSRAEFKPIKEISEIKERLSERSHSPVSAASPRMASPGALGQKLPQNHPPVTRAPRTIHHDRRRKDFGSNITYQQSILP